MGLFKNPNDKDNIKITKLVKAWIREKMNLNEEVMITVSELQCAEPNCPDMETVIVIFDSENTRQFKIRKPLNYIRKWDIETLSY